jgi:23S rRNA pseudouridine1911/1915/1917 synthase
MTSQYKGQIKVIYEDNHLLVVEKPVNISSQQDESNDPDMLTLLKEDIKERYNKPGNVFLGLVHRLDRPAGGVMVFAKTSKSASRLSDQIRQREFKKKYFAVIHGVPQKSSDRLVHYLLKNTTTNTVKTVSKDIDGAKEAVLDYNVLQTIGELSLVSIELHTGRSHQIRVQFSAIGHPLFGDQKYGRNINKPGQQMALWSNMLSFKHPTREEQITFECMPPHVNPWSLFDLQNQNINY